MKEMFEEVPVGGTYYIVDVSLDRFFEVKEYMLEGLCSFLLKELNQIVYAEKSHWQQGFTGETQFMDLEDFMDEIAL